MLCHAKPLLCGKKEKNAMLTDGNESEGEDMYGFLPKKKEEPKRRSSLAVQNIYEAAPRKTPKAVTFQKDLPASRALERRHSCAEHFRDLRLQHQQQQHHHHHHHHHPHPPLPHEMQHFQRNGGQRAASYPPAIKRSASFVMERTYERRPLPLPPMSMTPLSSASQPCHRRRPPPPEYDVAVRRAASFSASRGLNRGFSIPRRPPPVPTTAADGGRTVLLKPMPTLQQITSNLNRLHSSSTSELYVDAMALKRTQLREQQQQPPPPLSTASSTSSMSEATVYRKVGPGDYVSVGDTKQSHRKSFRCENSGQVSVPEIGPLIYTTDLENVDKLRIEATGLNLPRTDTYRFSMANLEDTQDVDLDAILGELCALESQYKDVANSSPHHSSNGSDISCYRRNTSSTSPQNGAVMRTESPDNDSAFSDSVSLFSSESSTSSSTTPSTHNNQITTLEDSKAEKIKLALQKMKEANVKKLFVKVFGKDGSAKSLLVDENMKCGYVMRLLADKHHMPISPRWGIVEYLPELYMERVYEEHEPLVENLMLWTRDSKNKLFFVERPERLLLFQRPEIFHSDCNAISTLEELSQTVLVEEYLSNGGLPNVEGPLYIKLDSKKGWKRYHAVLRASGLYYYKEKTIKSSKDLACLATFDVNQVYYGFGWKKKFKAPTEHCFAIKHPCLQQPKSTKYIKYLCAEDALTLHKWVTAIRIVKYGRQLLENYQSLLAMDECELSDSGSSGCDVAFESDFPCGTIKRKPPKLPLTATTRQLASLDTRASSAAMLERTPSYGSLPPPPPELLASSLTLNEDAEVDLPPPPPPPRMLPSPSATFLQDLQRVMRRKWQVAQKCKQDLNTTPHEVLGFRDPPVDYKETNVSNWVNEHYGGGHQNLYENVYRSGSPAGVTPAKVPMVPPSPSPPTTTTTTSVPAPPVSAPPPPPVSAPPPPPPPSSMVSSSSNASSVTGTPVKKRPPPPPPPRAETTQLTSTMLRCHKH